MPRVKRGPRRARRRKKILQQAKGYYLTKSKLHRQARQAVRRAMEQAFTGRRLKKRDFRSLWIVRINAAVRQHDLNYSQFVRGAKLAGIALNRKTLANLAIEEPEAYEQICRQVKERLAA